jgi:polysaccharide deacetylase family protein (PEP-CTERM system associated)
MINALSIDLEYWWSIEFLRSYSLEKKNDCVVESLNPIIKLLDSYNIRATFFVLGELAEKYPELIEEIHEKGHEIASHGYSHTALYNLTHKQFDEELKRSIDILKKYHPIGFRAPSFSINNETRWALEALKKFGFKYDSSIFPIKTSLYGVPDAPLTMYRPSLDNVIMHDPNGQIIEIPLTVLKIGKNIPVSGGFYMRALPSSCMIWALKQVNKQRPAIIYFHPWETYSLIPRVNLPLAKRIITYYGLSNTLTKLEKLCKNFKFQPMREFLHEV